MPRIPLTYEVVIERAAELADEGGLASVSLSAVARSLSVQTPSLYGHIKDLAAMRDGVSILALKELDARSADAIAGRDRKDALRAICDVYRSYASSHPGRWEALQRRLGENVSRSDAAARSGRTMAAVLRGYDIRESDRVHATRLIGAFLNGFVNLQQLGAFSHSEPDVASSWDEAVGRVHLLLMGWGSEAVGTAREERP